MIVPVYALAGVSAAESSSPESAESSFFAPADPIGAPGSFRVTFFEKLFGYRWSADAAVYQLHPSGPEGFDQPLPSTALGTNNLGDPFLITARSVLNINLDMLSEKEQNTIATDNIDRVRVVFGEFETNLNTISTIAILLHGFDRRGNSWWRVVPGHLAILDPDGVLFGDDDPLGHLGAAFGDCPCSPGPCDPNDPPPDAVILAICAVVTLVGSAVSCVDSRNTCRDTANAESIFCANHCPPGDSDCHVCCFDRWQIAIGACGLCGWNHPDSSEFSMCYE